MGKKTIAIIGGGVSGLGALYALKGDARYEVHLYESTDRLGGHAKTVPFRKEGCEVSVDVGFIVFNPQTYPNFAAFLQHEGIEAQATNMSFSYSQEGRLLEWSGRSLSAFFAHGSNILAFQMWRVLFDILRFNHFATDVLRETDTKRQPETVNEYLQKNKYSTAFRDKYLTPMMAAIWSTDTGEFFEFPISMLVRFMWNHQLLSILNTTPGWLTISGGSQSYVQRIVKDVPVKCLHLNTGVKSVRTSPQRRPILLFQDGSVTNYDHVIIATPADEAGRIVQEHAPNDEEEALACFRTSSNTVVLHSDESLMPRQRSLWSSWNFMATAQPKTAPRSICVSFWMNQLQMIEKRFGSVIVTMNLIHRPKQSLIQGSWDFRHPIFDLKALEGQRRLTSVQNTRNISYVGAWTGYGFHEDGFTSGLKAAIQHLGAAPPFQLTDTTNQGDKIPLCSSICFREFEQADFHIEAERATAKEKTGDSSAKIAEISRQVAIVDGAERHDDCR